MGADINYTGPRGITPLMWACKNDHEEIVEYLLENGAKFDIVSSM
jgi:ankyrin repeat protein